MTSHDIVYSKNVYKLKKILNKEFLFQILISKKYILLINVMSLTKIYYVNMFLSCGTMHTIFKRRVHMWILL